MPAVTRICAWKYKDSVTQEKQHEMLEGLVKVYEELKHTTNHGPVGAFFISFLFVKSV